MRGELDPKGSNFRHRMCVSDKVDAEREGRGHRWLYLRVHVLCGHVQRRPSVLTRGFISRYEKWHSVWTLNRVLTHFVRAGWRDTRTLGRVVMTSCSETSASGGGGGVMKATRNCANVCRRLLRSTNATVGDAPPFSSAWIGPPCAYGGHIQLLVTGTAGRGPDALCSGQEGPEQGHCNALLLWSQKGAVS